MKTYLLVLLISVLSPVAVANSLWLEHEIGKPWQRAEPQQIPLALQSWILANDIADDWPTRLQRQLEQQYCTEGLNGLGMQVSRSHLIQDDGTVFLSQQMQRQLSQSEPFVAESWLKLTATQSKSIVDTYLVADRRTGNVQSVMLSAASSPQTLWQFNFLPPQEQTNFAAPLQVAAIDFPERQQLLVLPARNPLGIQFVDVLMGTSLPISFEGSDEPIHATAMPALLDTDFNGAVDRIYQVSEEGLLYRIKLRANTTLSKELVADLQESGWQFLSGLTAMHARWPADIGWRTGDVLVIHAQKDSVEHLLMLKIPEEMQGITLFSQLTPLSMSPQPPIVESGWKIELTGKIQALPTVMAGILYVPLKAYSDRCAGNHLMDQLLALHLYQGQAVYSNAVFAFAEMVSSKLTMMQHRDAFKLMAGSHVIVPEMLSIQTNCLVCTLPISAAKYPKWQRIANYQVEQGAY